jgi:O-acetyl-ADP-ribose deacetylase (regulator of RNase III)
MTEIVREHTFSDGNQFQVVQGDLTQQDVDAIVNPANARLQHGGGVAGLIVRRGGSEIQAESNQWVRDHGPVSHAEPAHTTAGTLPCERVIHAVGPVWGSGDEDAKLAAAVTGSLQVADQLGLESIAFPAISTGIFGFPKERAAGVIFDAIETYFQENPSSQVKLTRLVLYDDASVETFVRIWDSLHG